jgi:alpha-D-xyloside xylohydrolase
MRPMFYDYPADPRCWSVDDQYMFGPDLLVAPVTEAGVSERSVYLPEGIWRDAWTGERVEGGRDMTCPAPVERIPVFIRDGAGVAQVFDGND